MDARQRALGMRDEMISMLARNATALVLETEPGRQVDKALHALSHLEDACRATITALSTSSHPSYSERDLGDIGAEWTRAVHAMRTLRLLYLPRDMPAEPKCDRLHADTPVRVVRDSPQA